jgi:hypothetical protein
MTHEQFSEKIISELKKRSMMSYKFTKKEHRLFRNYFFKEANKHLKQSKRKSEIEFDKLSKAFMITII